MPAGGPPVTCGAPARASTRPPRARARSSRASFAGEPRAARRRGRSAASQSSVMSYSVGQPVAARRAAAPGSLIQSSGCRMPSCRGRGASRRGEPARRRGGRAGAAATSRVGASSSRPGAPVDRDDAPCPNRGRRPERRSCSRVGGRLDEEHAQRGSLAADRRRGADCGARPRPTPRATPRRDRSCSSPSDRATVHRIGARHLRVERELALLRSACARRARARARGSSSASARRLRGGVVDVVRREQRTRSRARRASRGDRRRRPRRPGSRRHRLEHREPDPSTRARREQDAGRVHERRQIGAEAEEAARHRRPRALSRARRAASRSGPSPAISRVQPSLAEPGCRERAHADVGALLGLQPLRHEHDPFARQRRRCVAPGSTPGVHDRARHVDRRGDGAADRDLGVDAARAASGPDRHGARTGRAAARSAASRRRAGRDRGRAQSAATAADVGRGHVGVDDVDAGALPRAPRARPRAVRAAGAYAHAGRRRAPARMRQAAPPITATSCPSSRLRDRESQHELLDAGEPVGADGVEDAQSSVIGCPDGALGRARSLRAARASSRYRSAIARHA